ncbi:hypothetical protein KGY73_02140 [bacterium]|nr:hypothetical protein [bacterium]
MKRGEFYFGLLLLCLFFSLTCRHTPETVPSVPSQLEALEGYASLRTSGERGTARSKFSFAFKFPYKGKIGVTNFLGQTLYQIFITKGASYLVVPSKKVYWKGSSQEVIDKFLGFRLTLAEICFLLTGQKKGKERLWKKWEIRRDEKGRIKGGHRGLFYFKVKEYFSQSYLIRVLTFHHSVNEGRIKVLTVNFNPTVKEKALFPPNLRNYEQKTWREIQRMIQNEG